MSIVAIIICGLLSGMGYMRRKNIINPVTIYCVAWIFSIIMNAILCSFYGGYHVSDRVYISIILSVLFFAFGSMIAIKIPKGKSSYLINTDFDVIKPKVIAVLHVISYLIILPNTVNSINSLISGSGMYIVRQNLIVGDGSSEFVLKEMLKQVTALPIITATIYVAFDDMFQIREKKNKNLLLLALVDIVIYTVTYLGRFMIQNTIVYIVLLAISNLKLGTLPRRVKKTIKRSVFIFGAMALVSLTYITQNRSLGNGSNIIYTVVAYFGGPLKYFDTGIDVIKKDQIMLYGSALFAGLWDIILIPIQKLFRIDFLRPLEYVTMYNTPYRQIGSNDLYFTAFGTVFLNMYMDFRYIGIVVESAILGIISSVFYERRKQNLLRVDRIWYNTWLMFLFWSMLYWDGNRSSSILVFFYSMLMLKRRKFLRIS